MKKISKITFYFYVLFVCMVTFFVIKGVFTFGHGLGDLYYLIGLIGFLVIAIVLRVRYFKKIEIRVELFFITSIWVVIIFIILKLTIYRGAEYLWNGRFFLH